MITLEFLITSFIVVLIPGAGAIYSISTGLSQGRRAAFWAAFGSTIAILPHLLATTLGLAAIMHTSALAFESLKYAGAAYLLYLAYATWKDRTTFALEEVRPSASPTRIIIRAIFVSLLNPKLTIFFFAFLPQFISAKAASPLPQLLLLSGVFMGITFIVFLLYGLLAHSFRHVVMESSRVQNFLRQGFAATFAALGIKLALSDR